MLLPAYLSRSGSSVQSRRPLVSNTSCLCVLCAGNRPWAQAYIEQLLCPQDWFSFWRLNCRLASYHALVTGSQGYRQEDKVNHCVLCEWHDPLTAVLHAYIRGVELSSAGGCTCMLARDSSAVVPSGLVRTRQRSDVRPPVSTVVLVSNAPVQMAIWCDYFFYLL